MKAQKYLNGGKIRIVISPNLHDLICDQVTEKAVVKALKEQFKGRLHDMDLSQMGYFNYKILKLAWLIQAVKKGEEGTISEDVFDTKNNVYWVIISTAHGLKKYHINRVQKIKTKGNNHE
ncbi:hypothetical protein ABIS04_13380 [Shewanella sp. H8]|uniref:hypothetical protein n=1 Tax=Shewanella sp. H8 TaxID=3342676 RepID=UPI00331561DD